MNKMNRNGVTLKDPTMDRAMKTEELDTLLGKVVSFEENDTPYYQDRSISKGIPVGVQFTIEKKSNNNDYWLVADGYGNLTKPNAYGKGRICVGEIHLNKQAGAL